MTAPEKLPPMDLAAESCVLGSMMLSSAVIPKVEKIVKDTDFYRPAHQIIYRGICWLFKRGPIDLVLVKNALEKRGQLAEIGGIDYIAALAEGTPSAANAEYYAKIVAEMSRLRQLISLGISLSKITAATPKEELNLMLESIANLKGK